MSAIINYINADNLIKVMKYYGFTVFEDNSKNFNLNIVNIRNDNPYAGKFDDVQVIMWKSVNDWKTVISPVTTDPGVPYLLKPINKKGTAIVAPGQYNGVWRIGKHRGKYEALVQSRPILVIRDNNKDKIIDSVDMSYMYEYNIHEDIKNGNFVYPRINFEFDYGYFGINCHRASSLNLAEAVGWYSAGCCVYQNSDTFKNIINIAKEAAINWGNSFTATWITETDFFNALSIIDPRSLPIV